MFKVISLLFLGYSSIAYSNNFSCPDGKTYPVSLTFDDGPAGAKTNKVMDILKKKKIKGTFFVLGEMFETEDQKISNYAILDRMKEEGHLIGSHTYHHIAHTKVESEEAFANIDKANNVLKDYMAPIIRLPFGDGSFVSTNPKKQEKNDKIMNYIKNKDLTHVGWSIDTNDWSITKRPYILESMMKQICQYHGGVILFHDIQQNTVDHLEEWITEIEKAGHKIEPLDFFYNNLQIKLPKKEEADETSVCTPNLIRRTVIHKLSSDVEKINAKIK